MKKILSILQPFDAQQTIIAYEDGNKIDAIQVDTVMFVDEVCKFAKRHDIHEINIGGAKQYGKGIARKILEENLTTFKMDPLDVNLI